MIFLPDEDECIEIVGGPLDGIRIRPKDGETFIIMTYLKPLANSCEHVPCIARTAADVLFHISAEGLPQYVYSPDMGRSRKAGRAIYTHVGARGIESLIAWAQGKADGWTPRR